MADNVRECVAVDVGLELPARRVGVPGADVFGLEALEFLLRAEFVGLYCAVSKCPGSELWGKRTILKYVQRLTVLFSFGQMALRMAMGDFSSTPLSRR